MFSLSEVRETEMSVLVEIQMQGHANSQLKFCLWVRVGSLWGLIVLEAAAQSRKADECATGQT